MASEDDLEERVNLLLENMRLTEENQKLRSKVLQLEKQLRPFQKPEEEKSSSTTEKRYAMIFFSVVAAAVLAGIGYFFYRADQADSRSRQSRYEQAAKLQQEEPYLTVPYPRPVDYMDEPPEKYDKAREELEAAIFLNPEDAGAYWRRGELYANFGEYINAIKYFSKAIELNPNNGDYWISRATARCYLGDEDAATSDFNRLVVFNLKGTSPSLESTVQLGKCFFLRGEYDLARECGYEVEEHKE